MLHWDVLRLFDGVLEGLRAAGRDARPRRLRRRRLVGRRLRAARPCRPARAEPGQLPRHAARGRHGRRAREGVPRASSTSAPGIQLMPINTVFELAAMAAERRPGAGGGGDAADDPRPHALLARRQRGLRVHERDDDAVLRRARGDVGARPPRAARGIPTELLPEVVPPATALAPLAPRRRRGDAARRRHRSWRARRTTPPRQSPRSRCAAQGSAFISAGTWSLVGLELPAAGDRRPHVRGEPDERGRRRRHRPRAAQRHRSLAAPRVPPGLGARGLRPLVRAARRLAASAPQLRSLVDPNDPLFAAPDDMPRRIREYCASTGQPEPEDARGRRALRAREPRAEARADARSPAATRPASSCARCISSAAARATSCSAAGRRTPPVSPCTPGPSRRPRSGTCSSRRSRSASSARSTTRARSSAPRSSRRSYEPVEVELWREARERFEAIAGSPRLLEGVDA